MHGQEDPDSGTPPLSVLMCVYNGLPYLEEAVKSILGQTFARFEFIVIDDGSTDSSRLVLQRLAEADSRIRLVSRESRGQNVSLNEGLRLARAPLVARMDADDVALPDRLQLQVDYLRLHPECVALGGQCESIDERSLNLFLRRHPTRHEDIVAGQYRGACELPHPAVMFRRDAVLAAGGYDDAFGSAADFELWLRLGKIGELHNLPDTVLRYRVHYGQMSAQHRQTQIRLTRAAVARELARQGQFEKPWQTPPPRAGESRVLWHAELADECWERGSFAAARRHLWIAAQGAPFRWQTWARLLLCTCRVPGRYVARAARIIHTRVMPG